MVNTIKLLVSGPYKYSIILPYMQGNEPGAHDRPVIGLIVLLKGAAIKPVQIHFR